MSIPDTQQQRSTRRQFALRDFNRLQAKLPAMWREVGSSDPGGRIEPENTVVVVPSLTIDMEIRAVKQQAYEERFLFMLFILGQPHLRLIYVTSQPILPEIIDYYLDILPGAIISNARKRLFLLRRMMARHGRYRKSCWNGRNCCSKFAT